MTGVADGRSHAWVMPSRPPTLTQITHLSPRRTASVPSVIMTAAVVALVLLAALAVFQGLLVAGLPLGRFAWGGQNEVLPASLRIGSGVSIALYAFFAVLILQAAGLSRPCRTASPTWPSGCWPATSSSGSA